MFIHSMNFSRRQRMTSRHLRIGSFFLFFLAAAFTSAGGATALGNSPRPRVAGWIAVILSVAWAAWTIDYWVKLLPGILACATLNGILTFVQGHALNQPLVRIDRFVIAATTLALAGSAILSTAFTDRALTKMDRVVCMGIFASFAVILSSSKVQFLGVCGIVTCVSIGWAVRRRRHV